MKRILLISGTHGDEPSGPYIVFNFMRKAYQFPNIEFDFFPLINPVGFALGTRENGEGKDLNRWFYDVPHVDQPHECSALRNYFNSVEPYDYLISLHEDPSTRQFYLYDTGFGKDSKVIQSIFREVRLHTVPFFTGLDDPDLTNEGGGNFVDNGYCEITPDNDCPTLEEFLSRNKKVKKGITIEIPGLLDLESKIILGAMILENIFTII